MGFYSRMYFSYLKLNVGSTMYCLPANFLYMLLELRKFVDFMAYRISLISFQMTLLCNGLVDAVFSIQFHLLQIDNQ